MILASTLTSQILGRHALEHELAKCIACSVGRTAIARARADKCSSVEETAVLLSKAGRSPSGLDLPRFDIGDQEDSGQGLTVLLDFLRTEVS